MSHYRQVAIVCDECERVYDGGENVRDSREYLRGTGWAVNLTPTPMQSALYSVRRDVCNYCVEDGRA